MKLADKPGFVSFITKVDSHSSRCPIASAFEQPTRWQREQRLINPFENKLKHQPIWSCCRWRLPRFTSAFRHTRLCGPIPRLGALLPCCVRPLAVILLCAARTFLPQLLGGDCLASFMHILARCHTAVTKVN